MSGNELWRQSKRYRKFEPPDDTPMAEVGPVEYLTLPGRKARKVRIGAFGQFLTGLEPDEFERFVAMDRETKAARDSRPVSETRKRQREREADAPEQCFAMDRACLLSVKTVNGAAVSPDPDDNGDTWIDELDEAQINQLGTVIVTESRMREVPQARGEDSAGSTSTSGPRTKAQS